MTISHRAFSAGLAASALALPALSQSPQFEAPVQVKAGDQVIDMAAQIGYAGPTLHDANGDGLLDLYVGSFAGKILFAPNVGTKKQPAFGAGKFMQAEGKEIEISNW